MTTILGAAASALSHYERVMDVTAHNLANVNTAGFKRSSSWRTWLSPTIGRVRRSNTQPHPSQLPRLLAAYSQFCGPCNRSGTCFVTDCRLTTRASMSILNKRCPYWFRRRKPTHARIRDLYHVYGGES